jgi:alkylation response protein AidB-like acyl-CoA dehydrogenase
MDLTPSPQEEAFREEVREWVQANPLGPFAGSATAENPDYIEHLRRFQRKLAEAGWLGLTWPKEYGGRGVGPVEQAIFLEELARVEAPMVPGMIGIAVIGPAIAALGTEEQKKRYLQKMLLGDEIWAQGFSEPNAGSDLGSLTTRAVRDGDHFVVNGQKTWTSLAHVADWIFLLTRTDPEARKYQGLTCLLVDMKSEGVSVRPLRMMTGDADFNEVFFSDVRVPVSNVLGEINGGWNVAITALMFERANLGGGAWVVLAQFLDKMVAAARERSVVGDPLVRQKIARAYLELQVFRATTLRALSKVSKGELPGPEGSILKLFWSEANQRMAQSAIEMLGPYGQLSEGEIGDISYNYLRSRGNTIEAGTSEILRNTIAHRVLGLPKSY